MQKKRRIRNKWKEVFLMFFFLLLFLSVKGVFATGTCTEHTVKGWVFSERIGWISFSCENHDNIGEGIDYGIDVDDETGQMSGYAWSGVGGGWISFNESDVTGCPEAPCNAIIDFETNTVNGWAKKISNNEFISLNKKTGESVNYGVTIQQGVDPVIVDFHGWAWGDDETGWISFNCVNLGECSVSGYKAWMRTLGIIVQTNPARRKSGLQIEYVLTGRLFGISEDDTVIVWFEYGSSPENLDLQESTTEKFITGESTFSEILTFGEENIGNKYYFRAVAKNYGKKFGGVMNFTVSEMAGQIIIRYGDKERSINIGERGLIEIKR
jgi:hypothetical protein